MRALTVIAFCLAAIAARAQSWELGSTEAGPAPSSRRTLNAAASVHGHLVTWNEEYGSLFAARTSPEGEMLDPAALHIGYGGADLGALVAFDGEDYLVAWQTDPGPRTVRVTADGLMVPNDWKPRGRLLALVSNGRNYLLLYVSWDSWRPEAVLLNRNGVPVSGTLSLPQTDGHSLASRKGKWLLACGRPEQGEALLVEISESDFPPYPQSRSFELQSLLPPGAKLGRPRIAAGPRGFVLVSSRHNRGHDEIEVEWHEDGGLRGVERDPPREGTKLERPATVVWPSAPLFIRELQVAMHGPVVYVTYRTQYETGTIRFEGSRAEEVVLPTRAEAEVSAAALGDAAFWIDPIDDQVYGSRIAGAAAMGAPQLVSRTLPIQYESKLVSGGGVHLALWKEHGRDFNRLTYAMLASEGAPLTPPAVLAEYVVWSFAASDGEEFFVMWESHGVHGCIVASDGTIRKGPFEILPESNYSYRVHSLVWDGTTYVFSLGYELIRLSRDGEVGDRKVLYEGYGSRVRLYPVDGGFLVILDELHKIGCQCGFRGSMRTLVLDRNFERDDSRQEVWRDRAWEWWSWTGLATAAASPSGNRLLVRDDGWGDEGFRVAGDDGEFRQVPYGDGLLSSVIWDGQEFLVAAGDQLARHAPDGEFRGLLPLQPGTYASGVAVDQNRVPIVLMERRVEGRRRLLLARLQTASSAPGPAPR